MRLAAFIVLVLIAAACDDRPKSLPPSASVAVTPKLPDPPPPVAESPYAPKPGASAMPAPDFVVCQHVLVGYKGAKRAQPRASMRSKEEAKKLADGLLQRALADEDFTELVKKYSDDPAAVETLGNTGKFKREGMAKPFSDAAFDLKVGEISKVVETPFGFHIIKRNQ